MSFTKNFLYTCLTKLLQSNNSVQCGTGSTLNPYVTAAQFNFAYSSTDNPASATAINSNVVYYPENLSDTTYTADGLYFYMSGATYFVAPFFESAPVQVSTNYQIKIPQYSTTPTNKGICISFTATEAS